MLNRDRRLSTPRRVVDGVADVPKASAKKCRIEARSGRWTSGAVGVKEIESSNVLGPAIAVLVKVPAVGESSRLRMRLPPLSRTRAFAIAGVASSAERARPGRAPPVRASVSACGRARVRRVVFGAVERRSPSPAALSQRSERSISTPFRRRYIGGSVFGATCEGIGGLLGRAACRVPRSMSRNSS